MCICDREIEQGATGASCWPIGVASILAGFMCSHNVARHEVHKYQLRGSISNIRSGWLVDENGVGHTWSHHPAGQKGTTTPWSWIFVPASSRWSGNWNRKWNWNWNWEVNWCWHAPVRGWHICMEGQLHVVGKSWSWRSNQFSSHNMWLERPVVGIILRQHCRQTTNLIQGSWVSHSLLLLSVLRNLKAASNRESKKVNNYQSVTHEVSSSLARKLSCLWETWLPDLKALEMLSARALLLL